MVTATKARARGMGGNFSRSASPAIPKAITNIYPLEIEAVLCEHPAVVDAAVVGQPHAELGEEPVAFVVLQAAVGADQLADHCRKSLAPYKIPRAFHFVDDLPKTRMGKVAKPQLVERLKAMKS